MVIGLLVGLTILLIIVATFVLGGGDEKERQELARKRAKENLAPVGEVRLSGEPMPAVAKSEDSQSGGSSGPRTGQVVVQNVCIACHQGGFQNAPAIGDKEGWQPRAQKGLSTLVSHVKNGYGNMPAQGGAASEEEIRRAIQWMIEDETGLDIPEG
jgi:cytochrome c5